MENFSYVIKNVLKVIFTSFHLKTSNFFFFYIIFIKLTTALSSKKFQLSLILSEFYELYSNESLDSLQILSL